MTEVRVVPPLRNQLRPGRQRFGFGGFPRPVRVVSLPRVSTDAGRDSEDCPVYTEPGRLYEASGASPPRCVTRGSQAPSAWRLLIFYSPSASSPVALQTSGNHDSSPSSASPPCLPERSFGGSWLAQPSLGGPFGSSHGPPTTASRVGDDEKGVGATH